MITVNKEVTKDEGEAWENDTEKTGPVFPIVSSSSSPPNPRSFKNIKLKITFLSHGLYQWGKK